MDLTSDQFQSLALAEMDALYRMARRLTRDANRADDLVQETYARALRSRSRFQLQEFGIKPWLLRIMYNLHLNRVDHEKRQPVAIGDEAMERSASSVAGEAVLPIDPRSFQAMDEQLVHALDGLPEEYRATLLLWAVEELSYKEIAAALDVPVGTVMSRLHRARQRLARELGPYAAENRLLVE